MAILINSIKNPKNLVFLALFTTVIIFLQCYRTQERQPNFKFSTPFKPIEAKTNTDLIFSSESNLSQADLLIVDFIKLNHVFPPTKYLRQLTKPVGKPELIEGVPELSSILDYNKPGFFIECGANDGEYISNTIELEVDYQWTGLLVEASATLFNKLQATKRNAWLADGCLSGPRPERIEFLKHKDSSPLRQRGTGKIDPGVNYQKPIGLKKNFDKSDYISEGFVDCFPLYSILSAINVTHVDFFSLDVEGHEYKILAAIPYHLVHIEVILVEHSHVPEGKEGLRQLLQTQGYKLVKETRYDFLFQKKSF